MNKEKFLAGVPFQIGNYTYYWSNKYGCIMRGENVEACVFNSSISDDGLTAYSSVLGKSIDVELKWTDMKEVIE